MINKTNMEKIKILVIWLHIGNIMADNTGFVYRLYSGTILSTRTRWFFDCVRETKADSVGISWNPVNGICNKLDISWLEDKITKDGEIYMLKINSKKDYLPPMFLYHKSAYDKNKFDDKRPVEFQDRSRVEVYFSGLAMNARFNVRLRHSGLTLLKVDINYALSTLICTAMNHALPTDTVLIVPVVFVENKVEKLSIRTVVDGFEIYHDDQWIGIFSEPSFPISSFEFKRFSIWTDSYSEINIHSIYYIQ